MKRVKTATFYILFTFLAAGVSNAAVEPETIDSFEVLGFLLGLSEPRPPEIIDNMVIFTASSSWRRVGIAFAHEDFARVHWFRPLLVTEDPLERIRRGRRASPYRDSGVAFHIHEIPEGATRLEYRLIINGLWTTDPSHTNTRRDNVSGTTLSVVSVPPGQQARPQFVREQRGGMTFVFRGPPGETVTVAGSFNNWDPFMYELREGPSGVYSIHIPLLPGVYQYAFFHRGERIPNPENPVWVFSREGKVASEIVIY